MSPISKQYVVATAHEWNRSIFSRCRNLLPGSWELIERHEDLTAERIERLKPRYIFFPHWSWRVPDDITKRYECVCFHMTDVPYGRGGSPLQNLILRGHRDTVISALRMVSEMDVGPVYLKCPLSLEGSAQQIYLRAADIVFDMIAAIVQGEPMPNPQTGEPVMFERRRPEQSVLPAEGSLTAIHDFIRMLDADGYPHAFLDHGALRLTLTDSKLEDGQLTAKVSITKRSDKP